MNGSYDLEGVIWHQHSPRLMLKIIELWPDKNVPIIDLGCGLNYYITVLIIAGHRGIGLDAVDLGSKYFQQVDLTKPIVPKPVEKMNVLSLEVGEHIPAEFSKGYLDNVCYFGGDVILSWAVPGQAGHGHINCQERHWVSEQMRARGYVLRFDKTNELIKSVKDCHCSWFQNTIMYFDKESKSIV